MKKNIPIHPWLFALIPIINLFEHNQDIASLYYLPKPIIIALISASVLFIIFKLFIKNTLKSAFITSSIIVSFFLFNIIAILFINLKQLIPHPEALSLIIYITAITAIGFLITTSSYNFNKINKLLNFFVITILVLQLFNIFSYQLNKENTTEKVYFTKNDTIENKVEKNTELPDIYYIILDAYGREDVLKNIYNYDNSYFINFLEEKGFYVAKNSYTNYNQTFLSVSSSLNLNYLDKVATTAGYESNDRSILKEVLKNNLVYDFLKEKKYTFASLSSSWSGTYKNTKSDIHLAGDLKQNGFEAMLIRKTPLTLLFPNLQVKILSSHTNTILDKISEIANIKEATFSYIHILSPHPPFIFEADGTLVNSLTRCVEGKDGSHYFESCPGIEKYQTGYINQLAYLNKRFESIINEILEKSETPPIIILQGDHGPGSMLDWKSLENSNLQERMPILNAYYVPEKTKKILYPSISPVNSFRVIFNSLFDGKFKILEDKNYFATWDKPYKFIDVSNLLD